MTAFAVPDDSGDIEFFEFTLPKSKKVHRIPKLEFLAVGQIADLSNSETMVSALAGLANDEASTEALRSLRLKQVMTLMDAWQAASSVSLGESKAS